MSKAENDADWFRELNHDSLRIVQPKGDQTIAGRPIEEALNLTTEGREICLNCSRFHEGKITLYNMVVAPFGEQNQLPEGQGVRTCDGAIVDRDTPCAYIAEGLFDPKSPTKPRT